MENEKYHIVRAVPKSNIKIVEMGLFILLDDLRLLCFPPR
jgi:hypothetical protein